MNGQIQTELPIWLASLGLMLAIFLSWYTYSGSRNTEVFTKFQRIFLSILRGAGIFLICILVLGLFFKSVKKSELNPSVLIAIDNSKSMLHGQDTMQFSESVLSLRKKVESLVEKNYQVSFFNFGKELSDGDSLDFAQTMTDFEESFEELFVRYSQADVRELLILSDGIPTSGRGLKSVLARWPYPVSIISYGDSLSVQDSKIEEVIVSDIAYQNSQFPLEIIFNSKQSTEGGARVQLYQDEEIIVDTLVAVDPVDGKGSIEVLLNAEDPGINHYEAHLRPIAGEINEFNNSRAFIVEVVEQKNKVLLVYDQPHPDISVISDIIEETGDYELLKWSFSDEEVVLSDFAMAIIYQLPSLSSTHEKELQEILESDLNLLYLVGPSSSSSKLSNSFTGIEFTAERLVTEDFGAYKNDQFDLFIVPDGIDAYLDIVPPLKGQLTNIRIEYPTSILLFQKIKGIELNEPLIWFTRMGPKKVGFIWGEGIWRWKSYEYLYYDDQFFTESLLRSMLSYLSINDVDDPLKIEVPSYISTFEKLKWQAKLYNESFELSNDPVLYIDISYPSGEFRKFEFRKFDDKYWMELSNLSAGHYEYKCYTHLSGVEISKTGSFEVVEVHAESLDTKARLTELMQIADQKGGAYFRFTEVDDIEDYYSNLKATRSSEYLESSWKNLLDWHILLFIIVGIFAMEWILRRFLGTR